MMEKIIILIISILAMMGIWTITVKICEILSGEE